MMRKARLATSPATLSLYCQGLNQSSSGTAKNASLINLHLATGQIGKPGAGPFSLTGQPNAMGGREVGGMANLLSAHRDLANPAHRAEVALLWGVEAVPATPGKTAVEMFDAVHRGEIKLLWIAAWIVIPAYAFYCVSMGATSKLDKGVFTPGYASPNGWIVVLGAWIRSLRFWAIAMPRFCATDSQGSMTRRSHFSRIIRDSSPGFTSVPRPRSAGFPARFGFETAAS